VSDDLLTMALGILTGVAYAELPDERRGRRRPTVVGASVPSRTLG